MWPLAEPLDAEPRIFCAAVGRALGGPLANANGVDTIFPQDFVSYVSIGNGSADNAHFLSATNIARYAQHKGTKMFQQAAVSLCCERHHLCLAGNKCPVVFGISDNKMCISLKSDGWFNVCYAPCHCRTTLTCMIVGALAGTSQIVPVPRLPC